MGFNPQKMLMQMQQDAARIQAELEATRIEASAGGGVVKATVTGKGDLVGLAIDPAAVDPGGDNQIGVPERRVVTVSVAAATDALYRAWYWGATDDHCLRGGTFHVDAGDQTVATLTDCSFAKDVVVNGTVTWGSDESVVADLTVSGPGTAGGTLHVAGTFLAPGPVGDFHVSGQLGGSNVAVLVPEA